MDDKQQPDSPDASDWVVFLGFRGSVLFGAALPFFLGIAAVQRLLPFGELQSWMHGWRAVLGILGIFMLWFFATYLTDRMASHMVDKHSHPVLHELAGDTLSVLLLFILMSSMFTHWQASLICSLLTSALTAAFGLAVNAIIDRYSGC
ncbi:hypothetical protein [uncultured Bifidobacterium sp.]|uniref:hypothetical protein n=1 Tax=uncultured Bifidobacterium sp. TaxID=165187 RepID=UPI00262F3C10|nr:hypothetical protein [uncultured Bifidobacterium sp.]